MYAGLEHVAKAYECRATLVFNHVSYTDGIMLGAYFLPCGLAKASVADIPFFGAFAKVDFFLCHFATPLSNIVPVLDESGRFLATC